MRYDVLTEWATSLGVCDGQIENSFLVSLK